MIRPTLEQIFSFGLEVVEKEVFFTDRGKERIKFGTSKRYNKEVIIYAAMILYNYTKEELHAFLNTTKNSIGIQLNRVKKARSKQDLASELYDSLQYLYEGRK